MAVISAGWPGAFPSYEIPLGSSHYWAFMPSLMKAPCDQQTRRIRVHHRVGYPKQKYSIHPNQKPKAIPASPIIPRQTRPLQQHSRKITIILLITQHPTRNLSPSLLNSRRLIVVLYCPLDLGYQVGEIREDRNVVFVRSEVGCVKLGEYSRLRCTHEEGQSTKRREKIRTLKTSEPVRIRPRNLPENEFPSTSSTYLNLYASSRG